MTREGLPTIQVRTLDHDGNVTGEVVLDPVAARLAAGNLEAAVENLGIVLDPTGGVPHGGAARMGNEKGRSRSPDRQAASSTISPAAPVSAPAAGLDLQG
jgi:hypothetical protein